MPMITEKYYKALAAQIEWVDDKPLWTQNGTGWDRIGKVAGYPSGRYWVIPISVDKVGKSIMAHRLRWYMEHGEIPVEIDHINGDGSDNRLCNLRSVTHSQNCRNKPARGWSSKYKGVSKLPSGSYQASVYIDGKRHNLGAYKNEDDAGRAYNEGCKRLGVAEYTHMNIFLS